MSTSTGAVAIDPARIERWMLVYLAVITGTSAEKIGLEQKLADFDIDSVDAVELTSEFEKTFGRELNPELFLRGNQSLRDVVAGITEIPQG